jgi:hypothetical protein
MVMGPEESIFDNLIFGFKKSPSLDMKALEVRAHKVMTALGFNEDLMGSVFKEHGFLGVGGCKITRADRQMISIGRALIMVRIASFVHFLIFIRTHLGWCWCWCWCECWCCNCLRQQVYYFHVGSITPSCFFALMPSQNPEMIVVHKPTALLDEKSTDLVLAAFSEYCGNRGFLMDPNEHLIKRRKRTLIYTAKNAHAAVAADVIFEARNGSLYPLKDMSNLTEAEKAEALEEAFKGTASLEDLTGDAGELGAAALGSVGALGGSTLGAAGGLFGAGGKKDEPNGAAAADTGKAKRGVFGRKKSVSSASDARSTRPASRAGSRPSSGPGSALGETKEEGSGVEDL